MRGTREGYLVDLGGGIREHPLSVEELRGRTLGGHGAGAGDAEQGQ